MTRILAVTLGNSTASLALATDGCLGEVLRVPVGKLDGLKEGFAGVRAGASGGREVPVVVASVNPPALEQFRRLAANLAQKLPEVAGVDFPIPLKADVEEPAKVGADRLLGALAAWRRAAGACVSVDCGTAITVNAVTADGEFAGGAILPGPDLMARALGEGTALLPAAPLKDNPPPLGRNTAEAISAGVLRGAAGAVAALVTGARIGLGPKAPVFMTGGGAERIRAFLPPDFGQIVPTLVLEGLVIAYREWLTR
jgi:type III pantothenate kinase